MLAVDVNLRAFLAFAKGGDHHVGHFTVELDAETTILRGVTHHRAPLDGIPHRRDHRPADILALGVDLAVNLDLERIGFRLPRLDPAAHFGGGSFVAFVGFREDFRAPL